MREIEFRGKDVISLKWVYGVPVKATTNCSNEYIEIVEKIEYETDLEYSTFVCSKTIKPETIGQYTGLKDKNGKKIFEGDILKSNHNANFYNVYWQDNRFYIDDVWGNMIKPVQRAISHFECEVFGNIYDNPDLVEKVEG